MNAAYISCCPQSINYVPAQDLQSDQGLRLFPKRNPPIDIAAKDVHRDDKAPLSGQWTQLNCSADYSGKQLVSVWVRTNSLIHALGITKNPAVKAFRENPHRWLLKEIFAKDMRTLRKAYYRHRKGLKKGTIKLSKHREQGLPYSLVVSRELNAGFACLGTRIASGRHKRVDELTPLWGGPRYSIARNCDESSYEAVRAEQEAYASLADVKGINPSWPVSYPGQAGKVGILQQRAPQSVEQLLSDCASRRIILTEPQCHRLMRQLAELVHAIHARHCYLRDLKPSNLLIYHTYNGFEIRGIDLVDLIHIEDDTCNGLSRVIRCCSVSLNESDVGCHLPGSHDPKPSVFNRQCSAPEVLAPRAFMIDKGARDYAAADNYALAAICFMLLAGQKELSWQEALIQHRESAEALRAKAFARLRPSPLKSILWRMLADRPDGRPDAQSLLSALDDTERERSAS